MGPVAAWAVRLLPCVPRQRARPRQPAATHAPTAPLMAGQLYAIAAALPVDGGESFVHHQGPTQITGSIQGPQSDAPRPWRATLHEVTRIREAEGRTPPPGPQQVDVLVMQAAAYQVILHDHAAGYSSHS